MVVTLHIKIKIGAEIEPNGQFQSELFIKYTYTFIYVTYDGILCSWMLGALSAPPVATLQDRNRIAVNQYLIRLFYLNKDTLMLGKSQSSLGSRIKSEVTLAGGSLY